MFGAHQAETFARTDRLKPFGHYAKKLHAKAAPSASRRQSAVERLSVFRALASAGAAITISRIESGDRT